MKQSRDRNNGFDLRAGERSQFEEEVERIAIVWGSRLHPALQPDLQSGGRPDEGDGMIACANEAKSGVTQVSGKQGFRTDGLVSSRANEANFGPGKLGGAHGSESRRGESEMPMRVARKSPLDSVRSQSSRPRPRSRLRSNIQAKKRMERVK